MCHRPAPGWSATPEYSSDHRESSSSRLENGLSGSDTAWPAGSIFNCYSSQLVLAFMWVSPILFPQPGHVCCGSADYQESMWYLLHPFTRPRVRLMRESRCMSPTQSQV